MKKSFLSFLFIFLSYFIRAQTKEIDSLWNVVKTSKDDTNKVKAIDKLSLKFGWQNGNYDTAIALVNQSLELSKKIRYKNGIVTAYNKLGIAYYEKSDYPKALDYYYKALKINEEIDNKYGRASNLGNIGIIYKDQNDYNKALKFFFLALSVHEEIGNKEGQAANLGNIGIVYYMKYNNSRALSYYLKAIKLNEEDNNKPGQAINLGNIGVVYSDLGDHAKALIYFKKALEISTEINNKFSQADELTNIGITYTELKQFKEAEKSIKQAIKIQTEIKSLNELKYSYEALSSVYNKTGNYKDAFEYYKKHIIIRDSIFSEDNTKATIQKELQFNYEKKAAADSVRVAEEKKVVAAQLKQEKTQRTALYGGLLLVGIFSLFMVHRYRITINQKRIIESKEIETQKQNWIISQQKNLIEERHKEITDSINYAVRIQHSFLATKESLDAQLKDYFIFFQPKDVVSGDFYWSSVLKNGNFIFATADSTGHGVPGAIMSLLNITALEKAVEIEQKPDKILNITRSIIIDRLKKDGSEDGGNDGMDCSICMFDFKTLHLHVAAANNDVWIIRDKQLTIIDADAMPVGKHINQNVPFSLHSFQLKKGDVVYSLTDGFADQFGGEKNKKFMVKNLKDLLVNNAHLSLLEQKSLLENTFLSWKGTLEQVDDVTVIGVKI